MTKVDDGDGLKRSRVRETRRRWYKDARGTALAVELIGERWALLIIRELMFGPRRFGDICGASSPATTGRG